MSKKFTGVWIPVAIYQDKKLTPTEKLILSDVFNLCNKKSEYFKSNSTIATEINISIASVTRTIKKLCEYKYIKCQYDGRNRSIKLSKALIKLSNQTNQIEQSENSKRVDSIQYKEQDKKQLIYPFESNNFLDQWAIWIDERRLKKIKPYTFIGEQGALHILHKISNGNEQVAISIINQSIINGYTGLFPLKKGTNRNNTLNADTAIEWASRK